MSKKKLPKNLAVIMVCSALILGSIGSVAYAKYDVNKSRAQVKEYTTKINSLKSDISNMQENDKPIKKEDVYKNLTALSTSGKAIEVLQNRYSIINKDDSEALAKNAKELMAYSANGQSGIETPWFTINKPDEKAVWTMRATYEFAGDTTDVMWVCRANNSKEILAVTTAKYNAKLDKFSDFETRLTGAGYDYVNPTNDSGLTKREGLEKLIEKLHVNEGYEQPITPEEGQAQVDAREYLKQQGN